MRGGFQRSSRPRGQQQKGPKGQQREQKQAPTPQKEKQPQLESPQQLQERKRTAEIVKGEVCAIKRGYFVVKNGAKTREINFASLRLNKREEDHEFTSSVYIKYEELVRKLIVGKDFECRKCSTSEFTTKDRKVVKENFDVYVGTRNVAIDFVKAGIFNVVEDSNPSKNSFDIVELKKYNTKDRKLQKIKFIGGEDVKDVVDTFVDHSFKCFILNVMSSTRYNVYIPEQKCKMNVSVAGAMIDKEKNIGNDEQCINDIKEFFGLNDVTITFTNYTKTFFANFKVGSADLKEFIISKGYANPTRRGGAKAIKEKEIEEKEEEGSEKKEGEKKVENKTERKPRGRVVGFGMKKDIYLVGFDGVKVYYYGNEEEAKVIEEIGQKCAEVKRVPIKPKDNDECIAEVDKKFYRAIVIHAKTGGNLVQLKDTGSYVVLGNNKLKQTTKEIKAIKAKINGIVLTSVEAEKFEDFDFETMLNETKQFFNKVATLELESDNKEAGRVTIEGKCLSTFLVENGFAHLPIGFKDSNVWGINIIKAQNEAKVQHLNVWRYGELSFD